MIKSAIKYITFCLLSLFYQQAYPQYPRGANLAIIENDSLDDLQLLSKCKSILEEEGYDICKTNNDSLLLTTNSYSIENLPVLAYYELNFQGTTILLRGYVMDYRNFESMGLQNRKKSWERSAFRSLNGSLWRTGFEDMMVLTEKIRSRVYGTVTWRIEKNHKFYFY
jgi:hypothetical protein